MDATTAVHVLSSPMGGFSLPDDAFRSVSLAVAGKVLEAIAGESANGVCLIDGRTWRVGWRNQAFSRLLRLTASDPAWADGRALFGGFSAELLEEARRAMGGRSGATAAGCAWRGIRFRIRISPFTAGDGPADLLAEFAEEDAEEDGRGRRTDGASAGLEEDAADLAAENRSLRRRLAELEAVAGLLPVGIGVAEDRDCCFVRANRRFADALGVSGGDSVRLSGTSDVPVCNPRIYRDGHALGTAQLPLQLAARDGLEVRDYEVDVVHADGRSVRLVGFAVPVRDEAGEILGAAGAFLDVTERRIAEEELARSRRLFERIAEATPGILQLEDLVEKRTVYTNGRAGQILGYPAEQVAPVSWDRSVGLVHPEDRARFEGFREAVGSLSDADVLEAEFRMRHADGSYRWLCSRAAVFSRLPDGRPDRVVCLAHDVTDARRNQDELHEIRGELEERVRARTAELERKARELERSNAELQQFANVASHDLQEPLRTVVSYTQFLAKRYRGQLDPAADEYIGYIVEGCLRMQRLIQDLLAYARIGARGSHMRSVSAEQCLREAMDNLSEIIARHGAQVQWDSLPVIRADPGQLVQVFQNLLENSVKFAREEPSRIRVSARPQPGEWLFQVEDNGIGMEPHYLQRIFLIFQRLHARSQYPGSGIGLSICKKIVEQHGGRIWAESARDVGSVFHFTLPDTAD